MKNIFDSLRLLKETCQGNEDAQTLITKIMSDMESWSETHYEMVQAINENINSDLVKTTEDEMGYGGMYELANDLTDEFEELHKDKLWGENNDSFFEEIETFIDFKFA